MKGPDRPARVVATFRSLGDVAPLFLATAVLFVIWRSAVEAQVPVRGLEPGAVGVATLVSEESGDSRTADFEARMGPGDSGLPEALASADADGPERRTERERAERPALLVRVLDEVGAAVVPTTIRLRRGRQRFEATWSDAGEPLRLELPAGRYTIELPAGGLPKGFLVPRELAAEVASRDAAARTHVDFDGEGACAIDLRVQRAAEVEVRLTAWDGASLGGCVVALDRLSARVSGPPERATTDEHGIARFRGLAADRYRLEVEPADSAEAPEGLTVVARTLDLESGARAREELRCEPPAGRVLGRLLDANGRVCVGHRVTCRELAVPSGGPTEAAPVVAEAWTDTDGRFELSRLPSRVFALHATLEEPVPTAFGKRERVREARLMRVVPPLDVDGVLDLSELRLPLGDASR